MSRAIEMTLAGDDFERLPTREGYDRWATIYDVEENPLVAVEGPLVAGLLGEVRGLRVLDVGCGTGRHASRLANEGAHVLAIDFAEEMLARAKAKPNATKIQFHVHDIEKPLPIADKAFDRIVCALVIDHVADLEGLFLEFRRVLRNGGFAVVSVMHPAMMLRGVQARFRDPETGREVRPESRPHQVTDYVNAALRAGFAFDHLTEHAVDQALANRLERARKYEGWPILLLLKLIPTS